MSWTWTPDALELRTGLTELQVYTEPELAEEHYWMRYMMRGDTSRYWMVTRHVSAIELNAFMGADRMRVLIHRNMERELARGVRDCFTG